MKRTLTLFASFILMLLVALTLSSCSLFGLSVEQAEANLNDAGYRIEIKDGSEYVESDENPFPAISGAELEYYLYAEKGDDKIYMYFFISIDAAESNYSFMSMKGLSSGHNNKVIYFGTKQDIKDSKI